MLGREKIAMGKIFMIRALIRSEQTKGFNAVGG